MTRREFETRFRDVDALAVEMLWNVFRHSTWETRATLMDALDRLQAHAELARWRSPRALQPRPVIARGQ